MDRTKQWVLTVDFKSAFDMMQRGQMLEKMRLGGYDMRVIGAVHNLLTDTHVQVGDERIPTLKGCP